jgi:biotin transport system substrate-specific component
MSTTAEDVDLVGDDTVENIARAALFAALIGACAYVSFPNPLAPQVPVTLQVLALFLAGIYLGPVWGGLSMALYLVAGAAGVPVWSGGAAGVGALLGPTGGYLWSYPIAGFVIGFVVHSGLTLRDPNDASLARLVGAMVAGTVVVYALGSLGIYLATPAGIVTAVVSGSAAFVPFELAKMAAAVGIVRSDAVAAK